MHVQTEDAETQVLCTPWGYQRLSGPFIKEYYSGVCYDIYIHHTLASWGPTFSAFPSTGWICSVRSCTQCLSSSPHRAR